LNRTALFARPAPLLAVVFLILCTSSCTVPLAPGYRILKESREVQFVGGPSPELRIRANFMLENVGNGELKFIDTVFPDEKAFGRKNLHVRVDGRDVALSKLPEEYQHDAPNTLRMALEPAWEQKRKRELVIEYTLSSPEDSGARITLQESSFHLGSRGWFPVLQPPKHLLAPYPKRPDKTMLEIRVPQDFLVLSRGTPAGRKQHVGDAEHRFLLRKDDLTPYIVAGRYTESSSRGKSNAAIFWTIAPLKQNPTAAGDRITAAWNVLQTDFGPLDKSIHAPHVVECPDLRAHISGDEGPAAASFPGGALVNSEALALGIDSEPFLEKVTHALAHNWFGGELYPTPDAAIGLGEGLPDYAIIVIDEARNGSAARQQRVTARLREYDAALKQSAEKPLGVTTLVDPPEQQRIALAKAPLFFIALEDTYGGAPIRAGLNRMVTMLRGREVGYDDLRAALEESTGKSLAETFRIWLYGKGIPKDFRTRYESANETHAQRIQ
jgi:hypothetical protein